MKLSQGHRLLLSAASANLADGVRVSAFPPLVAVMSASPFVVALTTALTHLPWLLFALYAGVEVDRRGAKPVLVLSHVMRVILVLPVIAMAAFGGNVVLLLTLIFAVGVLEVFINTAEPTLVPSIVDQAELAKTNGRLGVAELVMNSFVGVALGAMLFGVECWMPFVLIAVAYFAATMLVVALRPHRHGTEGTDPHVATRLMDGARFVCANPVLLVLAVITSLANFAIAAFFSVLLFYVERFGTNKEALFALCLTAVSAGSIGALAVLKPLQRLIGDAGVLRSAIVLLTLALAAAAASRGLLAAMLSFGVFGLGVALWDTVAVTFRQEVVPFELLGRANAFYRLVSYGSAPLGALSAGILAEFAGVALVGTMAASLALLCWPLMPLISTQKMNKMRRDGANAEKEVS